LEAAPLPPAQSLSPKVSQAPVQLQHPSVNVATNTHINSADGSTNATLFSTYLGGTNVNESHAVDVDNNGNVYAVGVSTDATSGQKSILIDLIPSGTPASATEIRITSTGTDDLVGTAVSVVDAGGTSGAVYVVGNDATTGDGLVLEFSPDLMTMPNAAMLTGATLNGVEVGEGGSATGVYLTGSVVVDPITGEKDVLVANLTPDLMTATYAVTIGFTDGSGNAVDSVGNALAVDSTGQVYVGISLGNGVAAGNTDNRAGLFGLSSDGMTVIYAFSFGNVAPGLGGGMFSVNLPGNDPAGYIYMTGSLSNGHAAPQDGTDMLIAKVRASDGALDPMTIPATYGFRYTVDMMNGDLSGTGIEVDSSGNAYVVGSIAGAPDPMTGVIDTDGYVAKISPTGDMVVTFVDIGNQATGTSTLDRAFAVELSGEDPNGNVYVVGYTESDVATDDFEPGPMNAFQADLMASRNGFAMELSQPLS
jgi:hypothetical protein